VKAGISGGEGEFRHGIGGSGGLGDDAMVIIEDFVHCDGDCKVGGCVEGVALRIEGFGFVGACGLIRRRLL
jgi:hypothetical protein